MNRETTFFGDRCVVCVPARMTGDVLSFLSARGLHDPGRKTETFRTPDGLRFSLIPVSDSPDILFSGILPPGASVASRTVPVSVRKPVSLKSYALQNRVSLEAQGLFFTDAEIDRFPAGRQMIGDIAVISVPAELSERKYDIARLLAVMEPRIRLVLNDRGISGVFREPDREILYPIPSADIPENDPRFTTEVVHEENGCRFFLDVMRLMFSKGNLDEKRRMAALGSGECVVDMFAGIGYFTIPMAVHARPSRIVAIELNPVSFEYLCKNIRLNRVADVVEPIRGDCGVVTPRGIADRVIMGYVGTTHHYLDAGIRAVKKEGGILHYHETVPEYLYPERPVERIKAAAAACGRGAAVLNYRIIKKYAPGVLHIVVDVRIF